MLNVFAFLLVIGICVVIHEGGHFLAAIWRGVQVHEFSFGMGHALWSKKYRGVRWSIRLFPVGGFVRLEGMEDDPLPDDEPDPTRAFPIKRAWERFVIIAGGAFFNIVLAWLLTTLLLSCYGIIDLRSPVIGQLIEGYPAAEMGAMRGDRVRSINGIQIEEWRNIREALQKIDGDEVSVVVERDGSERTLSGRVPFDSASGSRLWGVQPSRTTDPIWTAAGRALGHCLEMSVAIIEGLWQMITGRIEGEVAGPVGIAVMAGDAARQGFWTFITFLAVINLNLGLLNLMPLPALDGGRLIFLLGEMISGRRFPEKWEDRIHIVGFALLMVLIAFVTWKDIMRMIGH